MVVCFELNSSTLDLPYRRRLKIIPISVVIENDKQDTITSLANFMMSWWINPLKQSILSNIWFPLLACIKPAAVTIFVWLCNASEYIFLHVLKISHASGDEIWSLSDIIVAVPSDRYSTLHALIWFNHWSALIPARLSNKSYFYFPITGDRIMSMSCWIRCRRL